MSIQFAAAIFLLSSIYGVFGSDVFKCDFEENEMCGFVQQKTDGFDWLRRGGSTPTQETGPSGDHTLVNGTGHYIHIEASNRGVGSMARLETPSFDRMSPHYCVHFFYHMYGKHIGSLNVFAEIIDNHRSVDSVLLWNETGQQGNEWLERKVLVNITDDIEDFKIIFEGVRGPNFKGDIGVDDVTITDETCEEKHIQHVDCPEVMTVPDIESVAAMLEATTVLDNMTADQWANSSSASAVMSAAPQTITMTTLLIIVCCGVAFWTVIFLFVTIYILSHKPPTVEQLMKKYQNKQNSRHMLNNELETMAAGTTIANQTADLSLNNTPNDELTAATNSNQDVLEESKDKHYFNKRIDACRYDSKGVELSEASSDDSDDFVLCSQGSEEGSLFKELLQHFPKMNHSNMV
ncbi:uncharacterized protein [Ptychodera flava]|uniref:uncharacterized protein n=1 Tax=Ptychodera flava TaxID=63121 RepID=UPI00396A7A76